MAPTPKKKGRRGIDWERIERDYRAGQLSIAAIAKLNRISQQAIRNRAKNELWSRDLSAQVRTATQARLLAEQVPGVARENERQIVDEASARAVEVVRRHQRQMGKLADVSERLTDQLLRFTSGKEMTVEIRQGRETIADILQKVAVATARYVPLERRAWSIDDAGTGEDLASWLKAQTGLD